MCSDWNQNTDYAGNGTDFKRNPCAESIAGCTARGFAWKRADSIRYKPSIRSPKRKNDYGDRSWRVYRVRNLSSNLCIFPRAIVLVGHGEFSIHSILLELKELYGDSISLYPQIADIQDKQK